MSILKKVIFLALAYYLMTEVHWIFGVLFIGSLLYNFWYWVSTYSKFRAGDVNPGKVISINPDRVAVATNMTKFGGHYPILKIIETKLPKFEKKLGNFIPTVALYNDNPHGYPFWAEFHPVPISHGTTDRGLLRGKFNSFSQEDFETLDKYIEEVNSTEPGTYKVEKETSGWQKFPDVEVGSLSKMKPREKKEG